MAKITKVEKYEAGIGIALIVVILLLAFRHGQAVAAQDQPGSEIPTIPSFTPVPAPQINLSVPMSNPTYTLPDGNSCSCGCNNQLAYGGLGDMIAAYDEALNGVVSAYYAATLAALPSYVKQYIGDGAAALTGWGSEIEQQILGQGL